MRLETYFQSHIISKDYFMNLRLDKFKSIIKNIIFRSDVAHYMADLFRWFETFAFIVITISV